MARAAPARCLCGCTSFGVRLDRTQAVLPRWRPVPQGELQGWGRFDVTVMRGVASTCCLSCQRRRRSVPVGGGTAMTSVVGEGVVDVVMTDVVDAACMTARYELPQEQAIDVPIEIIAEVPVSEGAPLELREALPPNVVTAMHVYRVPIPEITAHAGVYRLMFIDHCLGTRQRVRDVALTIDLISVYGRGGHVVAKFGTYPTSFIATGLDGVSLAEAFDLLHTAIEGRAKIQGDLGGTGDAPRVLGLQGRAVRDEEPSNGAVLVWSAADQRWEPRLL